MNRNLIASELLKAAKEMVARSMRIEVVSGNPGEAGVYGHTNQQFFSKSELSSVMKEFEKEFSILIKEAEKDGYKVKVKDREPRIAALQGSAGVEMGFLKTMILEDTDKTSLPAHKYITWKLGQ